MTRAAVGMAMIAGLGLLVNARGAVAQKPTPESLEHRAEAAVEMLRYSTAGDAYRQAARLRSTDDPEAIRDLQLAGLLYANADRQPEAQVALEAAGERALSMGDPAAAAEAFTNAAMLAADRGSERAAMLADRARRLAGMDEVSAGKRALILQRLGPGATIGGMK